MTSSHNDSGAVLQLRGLCKHYGAGPTLLKALDGVDLDVTPGQLFGLIGHNGAGKSTLFKLLLGLIRPTAGSLRVLGEPVDGPRFRELRRLLGYLPENLVLYDNLSGLETLQFFARLKGAPLAQCEPLLDQVGLATAGRRAVREYSKGMRQRLGFAQALLGEPRLLLLDEPTTGLDPAAIRDFYQQLDALRARGVTLVISSHILAELQGRVDALAMLSAGRLKAQGTVQALRERSAMPLRFLLSGTPAQLDALPQQLSGLMERLQLQCVGTGQACLRCPRELKMPVLQRLSALALADLSIQEPSLEDVYFELREAA
ncbi:ABC transporter ATP-binding protein [Roseateles flavus]|uniref:ABC transporter ATP-binding protein n=1 Tax=Roseateles flavus TaxID=3149041 RepID=A0ABV0GFM0_9BURK